MNSEAKTLLVVDDETDLLEMYKDYLESEGFVVFTASCANEAMKLMESENQKIDLIISDSHMGKVSGQELFINLKNKYLNMPKFYLSTGDVEQSEEEVFEIGITRLILKPFDLDEIVVKIKEDLNL